MHSNAGDVAVIVSMQVGFAKNGKISALDLQLYSNCGNTVDYSVSVSDRELVYSPM